MYIISITNFDFLEAANRFLVKKGWTHSGRKYNKNILVFVEEGECSFYVNGKKYRLEKDSYIVIPKGVFYKPHTETFCQYRYFHFVGEYLGEIASIGDFHNISMPDDVSLSNCFFLSEFGKSTKKFILHLNSIMEETNSNAVSQKNRMNIAFFNALNCISGDHDDHDDYGLAYKIHQYIVENLTKPLNLSDISSHFGYSNQHIINQFKRGYNMPPTAFILQKRLELSSIYLLETSLTINEISSKCGFNDSNYYSRAFRKKYNLSPQNYREYYLNTH